MQSLLSRLCTLNGTSGNEQMVRDFIISQLNGNSYKIDALGNLIVEVKGKKRAKNKVMLCAHMDEVGIVATYICKNGLIKFATVGGIQPSVLLGRQIEFLNGVKGVTCVCPVHLLSPEQMSELPDESNMYIDIGCNSDTQTQKYINPGDSGVIYSLQSVCGSSFISKAIDDRAGCAVMLNMIQQGIEYDAVFVFSVQEEVGLRGAGAAAYSVSPNSAIVLEATTAADIIDAPEDKKVCILNKGCAVSFMDNRTVYPFDLYKKALYTANKYGIAAQPKTAVAGGNDAGVIHTAKAGVRTITLSLPCRYIHSPSCVCSLNDLDAMRKLAEKLCEELCCE